MFMKSIVLILLSFFISVFVFAQNFEQENTLMVETNFIMTLSFSYDRVIDAEENVAFMVGVDYVMGVGFGFGSHWIVPEVNLVSFGPNHFLETGIIYAIGIPFVDDEPEYRVSSAGMRIAYRYQTNKGFILRATGNIYFNIDPIFVPAIGVGYAF